MWRTLWNGWVSARRMRSLDGREGACIFGCRAEAQDSIEHCAHCSVVAMFARRTLGLAPAPSAARRLEHFLGLDLPDAVRDRDAALRRALRTAAVYRAHCLVRHGRLTRGAEAAEALPQCVRELTRGHASAGCLAP